ncbi:hypothetical protein KAU19_08305, partial [Candidatus Parcubacteria bacterium]|nr:hypothetical protein [Candidatus Parcubacteria bacterium]
MAQILIKVGDKRRIDDPAFNADWRDGHIICVRPDGYYTGIQTRKSQCVIETQHNFFGLFNANSYDDLANRSLFYDFKKYFYPATADGKYPFIENKELDYGSFLDWRMREYFIDFQWMLNQRWINKNQYESIYNKSENHQHIYLDHDLSSYIFHEDSKDRVTPNVPIVPGTIDAGGTFTVGTAQTYSDWSDAIADLPADIGAMST